MKVVCIKNGRWFFADRWERKHWWSKKTRVFAKGPKKDDVVTVETEYWKDGEKFYRLVEWPRTDGGGYDATCFKPLDEEKSQYKEVELSEIKKKTPAPSVN